MTGTFGNMLSHDKIIISQYSSSIGNGVGSKTVKMTEIEKIRYKFP